MKNAGHYPKVQETRSLYEDSQMIQNLSIRIIVLNKRECSLKAKTPKLLKQMIDLTKLQNCSLIAVKRAVLKILNKFEKNLM